MLAQAGARADCLRRVGMTFLYFAYGSNMLTARLRARCPSARIAGTGNAVGSDLAFSKASKDGSGKATLITSADAVTPGVIFEIASAELRALDRAEGLGVGYERLDDFIIRNVATGASVSVTTYRATVTDDALIPYDWYLALVIAGARRAGLADGHIERLLQIPHLVDPDPGRAARRDAVHALLSEGFDDYQGLLKSKL